jgi:hypothetical protein
MRKRVALIALAALIALTVGTGVYFGDPPVDRDRPPQFIQADFIDVSRVAAVSKFRSGMGLDYSGGGESCRNMKHYFIPNGQDDIRIYAPVDGRVAAIYPEKNQAGQRIVIHPDKAPEFQVSLFHITPNSGLSSGATVTAGQQIGTIGARQTTDIDIQIGRLPWSNSSVSYFQVLPDRLFAAYQARGVASRSELIITKQYRDAHPLTCSDGRFVYPDGYDHAADAVSLKAGVQ